MKSRTGTEIIGQSHLAVCGLDSGAGWFELGFNDHWYVWALNGMWDIINKSVIHSSLHGNQVWWRLWEFAPTRLQLPLVCRRAEYEWRGSGWTATTIGLHGRQGWKHNWLNNWKHKHLHKLIEAMDCTGPCTGKHTKEIGLGSPQNKFLWRSLQLNCWCQNPKHEESMSSCEFWRDFFMLGTARLAVVQTYWTIKTAWAWPSEHAQHWGTGMGGAFPLFLPWIHIQKKINVSVEIMVLPTFL